MNDWRKLMYILQWKYHSSEIVTAMTQMFHFKLEGISGGYFLDLNNTNENEIKVINILLFKKSC